jgi:hypothetical protein
MCICTCVCAYISSMHVLESELLCDGRSICVCTCIFLSILRFPGCMYIDVCIYRCIVCVCLFDCKWYTQEWLCTCLIYALHTYGRDLVQIYKKYASCFSLIVCTHANKNRRHSFTYDSYSCKRESGNTDLLISIYTYNNKHTNQKFSRM